MSAPPTTTPKAGEESHVAPTAVANEPPEPGTDQHTTLPSTSSAPKEPVTNLQSESAQEADQQIPGPLEETAITDDADSAIGDDLETASYTTSLTDSIWDYEYENGRRYHAFRAGQYVIPNDEKEQDRLDLMHHLFYMILEGKLHLAPIGEFPQRVLDIGTGTGIWAIDFADHYKSAEVIGLDLSPIQPNWVPPNLKFEIDDCESQWTFPETKPFSFIHMRAMGGSIANWPALLKQAYTHLEPGGWLELVDFDAWASTDDDSLPKDSSYHQFQVSLQEAATKFGRIMIIGPHHKKNMEDAGFVDVVYDMRKAPLSPWSEDPKQKEMGRFFQVQMLDAVESYGLALLTRVLGWTVAETQVLIAGARQDLRNKKYHMYSKCHRVYGRKPLK